MDNHHLSALLWASLGIFGGVVKLFGKWLNKESRPDTWRETSIQLFLNIFISGFSGYMGAVISMGVITKIFPSPQGEIIAAGIFGYLGVYALDMFSKKYLSNIIKT